MKIKVISVVIIAITFMACSKSNEETEASKLRTGSATVNVFSNCDTVNMKYATGVQPILKANCYSCHGSGNSEGGIRMDTYTEVKNLADNTNLLGVITHAPGYDAMPEGSPELSDCNINIIRDWINRGAPNN